MRLGSGQSPTEGRYQRVPEQLVHIEVDDFFAVGLSLNEVHDRWAEIVRDSVLPFLLFTMVK